MPDLTSKIILAAEQICGFTENSLVENLEEMQRKYFQYIFRASVAGCHLLFTF